MPPTYHANDMVDLKDYEIESKIADGSMASVYRARRVSDGKRVAVKVPFPSVAKNAVLRERFYKEYWAGKSLIHPNIVRALDFGQTPTSFFLVMEYVDGPDLWQRIESDGRLPEKEAVRIVSDAARGLHQAHERGIIHRDVKPDNIMITSDGQAKLGDLGLIKELEADLDLTNAQKGLGTPNFMSPEQFGDARNADVRCDVYSLGATLYMAVTGVLPFAGKNVTVTLRKKLNDELTPPRELVPSLSKTVDWAIRRAVQIDPERRQPNCLAFIDSLNAELAATADHSKGRRAPKRPPSGQDKRRAARYSCTVATLCELQTSIHTGDTAKAEQWQAEVLNLSSTGAGMAVARRFEPGTIVSVILEDSARTLQVPISLCVVRCLHYESKKWFLGGAFTEPLAKETLRKLLWNSARAKGEAAETV